MTKPTSPPADTQTATAFIHGGSGRLGGQLIPDPADRLSKADRPPPCAVIAVALINRIPYETSIPA
jgi:hypothetical protein